LLLVLAVLFLLWKVLPETRTQLRPDLIVWFVLAAAASAWPVGASEGRPYLALDLPILLACAFVNGPLGAGIVALFAATNPQELRGQMPLSRCVWNHAQVALSVISAGVVFDFVGGDAHNWPRMLLASELALAADSCVNYVCVALTYALGSGRRLSTVLRSLYIGTPRSFLAFYAGLGAIAALMAAVYAALGLLALLMFVAPLCLAREALRQTLLAVGAERDLASRREALLRVDERISEERADERDRIAAALHDDVLQSVFDITIRAHVVKECFRRGQLLELDEAVPNLVTASERVAEELRDVIHGLRRSQVGHAGLVDSLHLLVLHLHDQSNINLVADLDSTVQVPPQIELAAYQVARECLVNAVRHSMADTIWISLKRSGTGVELRVLDNGVGFDPAERRQKHFGLELMEERVSNAGGVLRIESGLGNGALLVVWFEGS
jgi:signal transduction histidine kinase